MKKGYALILFVGLVFAALVVAGVTNSLGTIDVEIPITDSWLVNGSEIEIKTINGQVMVLRRVNVDMAGQPVEDIGHGLRSDEELMSALKVAVVSTEQAVKESHPLTRFDLNGRALRAGGVLSDRMKLLMIYTVYLHSKRP